MYNVGDKFIIELDRKLTGFDFSGEKGGKAAELYRVKGFNSLVFDEFGLGKLEKYEGEKLIAEINANKELAADMYWNGFEDAWYLAQRVVIPPIQGGFSPNELQEMFGHEDYREVMQQTTSSEAIAKFREYEAEEDAIQVGDEVVLGGDTWRYVVIAIDQDDVVIMGSCRSFRIGRDKVTMTGRHFPEIPKVIEQISRRS